MDLKDRKSLRLSLEDLFHSAIKDATNDGTKSRGFQDGGENVVV